MQMRMVIFIVLSLGAWMLLNQYYRDVNGANPPQRTSEETSREVEQSVKTVPALFSEKTEKAPTKQMTWSPQAENKTQEKLIVVSTNLYRAVFSSRGGRLVSFQVNKYRDRESGEAETITQEGSAGAYLTLQGKGLQDADINYQVDAPATFTVANGRTRRLKFYRAEAGGKLSKEFIIYGGKYQIDVDVALQGKGTALEEITLSWGPDLGKVNKEGRYADVMQAVILKDGQVTEKKLKGGDSEEISGGAASWVAMKKRYFICLLRAERSSGYSVGYHPGESKDDDASQFIRMTSAVSPDGNKNKASFSVYLGPLEYYRLAEGGDEMQRALTFGFFNSLGVLMLKGLHYFQRWTGSWGLAIIILSVIIKLILWWPTSKSQRSMRQMQETMKKVQPMINALKKKYKDDQQRLSQEQMKLFKEHKVNPAGGCLPMLLQLPIFWALYTTLANAIELRGASFLWMGDLASSDPLYILPVLMGLTSFIQQKASGTAATATGQQKMMMYFFPLFLTVISVYWPSGLLLYWVVSNVLYIGQIYMINRNWKTAS